MNPHDDTRRLAVPANVLRLPTADLPRVVQRQRLRGRDPEGVAALWRERVARDPGLRLLGLAAARERALEARTAAYQRAKALFEALRAAEAAEAAASAEYLALASEVGRIDAEIAALVRSGVTRPADIQRHAAQQIPGQAAAVVTVAAAAATTRALRGDSAECPGAAAGGTRGEARR